MTETARAALARATAELTEISETSRLDAELLMAHAMGIERDQLLLFRLDDPAPFAFDALIERRQASEPVAYILGYRDFWTIRLRVAPGVLIPRPDSETLIEAALDYFGKQGPDTILDLGTGSGALLLAALDQWPNARGIGVDRSPTALAIAADNADRLQLADRADWHEGDWDFGLSGRFDLILCNPPYIEIGESLVREVIDYEPGSALFAGDDGLDDYRRLASRIGPRLAAGGMAAIEIGSTQALAVSALLQEAGLKPIVRQDLGARDRCICINII